MAKIQLIALLLGVGFNGLWWREQKRHFYDFADAQRQAREAGNQADELRRQLQEAQRQIHETQKLTLELQNLPRDVQSQIQEAQNQTHDAQLQVGKFRQQFQEFESKVRDTQSQLEEARQRALAAESKVREAQQQVTAAQARFQIQNPDQNARRLTRIFALLAVLALMIAGAVTIQASRQYRTTGQALVKATVEASGVFYRGGESIQQVLQKIGGTEQDENRRRSLERLASDMPQDEISKALKASSVIVSDQQRSHFQKCLLIQLGLANPIAALTKARTIEGKIVNDEGGSDSSLYFQLAVLDNWLKTDLLGALNWVCQQPEVDFRQRARDRIIHLLKSQPDSGSKNKVFMTCIGELAKRDVLEAWFLAKSLPEGEGRETIVAWLWMRADPFAISEWINSLILPPEIMSLGDASWPWIKFFKDANFGRPEILPMDTNAPVQIQLQTAK